MVAVAEATACGAVTARERQQERFDLILRLLPVGVFVADAGGRIVTINDTAVRLWGRASFAGSADEYGQYVAYRRGESAPIAASEWALARALRGEEAGDEDLEIVAANGERRTIVNSVRVLHDGAGRVTGGVAVNVDISDRKRAEEFRERFIGILSHDLRTPLAAITLSAGSLLQRAGPGADARSLERVVRNAGRMERMIRDLLDFTRARQGGGIPVTLQPGDLGAICRHVVDDVRITHPDRAVELRSTGATRGHWDPDRVAQVVQNLVVNACDHSPSGAAVEVAVDGAGERVVVAVRNEGPPIPEELRACLFDPFRRGARALERGAREGLGLGLYIAREIVRAHDGRILVESDAARGTVFRVELPRSPTILGR
jgi:signal transduction histidine kinase